MNEYLTKLYGTDQLIKAAAEGDAPADEEKDEEEEDMPEEEKKAALALENEIAESFVKQASEEGVDLEKLSENEVAELFVAYRDDVIKEASASEEQDMSEKLAEADFYGRAMAHAYVQELSVIEKEAGKGRAAYEAGKKGASSVGRDIKKLWQSGKKGKAMLIGGGAAVAGQGAGAALGARALKKKMEKKSADEQYLEVVQARAAELLKEAGYSEEDEKIAARIEHDALSLLEANGYPVEWKDAE